MAWRDGLGHTYVPLIPLCAVLPGALLSVSGGVILLIDMLAEQKKSVSLWGPPWGFLLPITRPSSSAAGHARYKLFYL